MREITEQMIDDQLATHYAYVTARSMVRDILQLQSQLAAATAQNYCKICGDTLDGYMPNDLRDEIERLREALEVCEECGETTKVSPDAYLLWCKACWEKVVMENKRLKEFTRYIIRQECWAISDLDGGEVQDVAESLKLIEPHIATEEDVDDESIFEIGDPMFVFTDMLKE